MNDQYYCKQCGGPLPADMTAECPVCFPGAGRAASWNRQFEGEFVERWNAFMYEGCLTSASDCQLPALSFEAAGAAIRVLKPKEGGRFWLEMPPEPLLLLETVQNLSRYFPGLAFVLRVKPAGSAAEARTPPLPAG